MILPRRFAPAELARTSPLAEFVRGVMTSRQPLVVFARYFALALVFVVAAQSYFHMSLSNFVAGISLGALYGIIGVGLILTYRTLRIINFATAAIGAVPAILAMIVDIKGWANYWQALPIALLGGMFVAILADLVVMRRFKNGSRLVATVVTIGIAQSLSVLGFFIPIWLGINEAAIPYVPTPWAYWHINASNGQPILTGNQLFALVAVIAIAGGLWAFLRYTRVGIALRAASENADRAALLGIPVRRVQTAAWALAGLLSGLAVYAQGPLIAVPRDATLGYDPLLYGLAAAVIAGMEGVVVALGAGMAIGLIIFGSVVRYGDNSLAVTLMLVIILVALIVRRGQLARAYATGVATWREVKLFKKVPAQLVHLPEVRIARWGLMFAFVALLVGVGFFIDGPDVSLLTLVPLYGIVAVSLVVLTGWAGQISLGQFGIVGAAAGVAGGLVANHGIDFFAAIGLGMATGAVAAALIGLPALRVQGLYLAVTTLAFGYVVQFFVLNNHYFIGERIMPQGYVAHVTQPLLYGVIDLSDARNYYYACITFLFLAMLAAMSFRRFRSGRVLMAARDNQRAAAAYGINVIGARLAAFAISGAIAGLAGVLFAYAQHNVVPDSYSVLSSITLFLATTIGGLGSLPTAVLGAMSLEASVAFGPRLYQLIGGNWAYVLPLLLTGPLLIIQLIIWPGGLAEGLFKTRDDFLRFVAARRKLVVPSLIADRKATAEELGFKATLSEATHELEAEHEGAEIVCPVCGAPLTLQQAAQHEHLRAPQPAPVGGGADTP
ncbi:MAG TPA: ABC transporter permease [Candidatus Dormibacteraeota bacterium]